MAAASSLPRSSWLHPHMSTVLTDLPTPVVVMPSLQHALRNPSQAGSLTSSGPVQEGAKPFQIIAAGGNPWRQRRRRSPKGDWPASSPGPFRLGWAAAYVSFLQLQRSWLIVTSVCLVCLMFGMGTSSADGQLLNIMALHCLVGFTRTSLAGLDLHAFIVEWVGIL